MAIGNKTFAQTEPTLDETVEWIRSKLVAYGGSVRDVQFDKSNYTFTIYYSDDGSAVTNYISRLNGNTFAWSAYKDVIILDISSTNSNYGSTRYTYNKYNNPQYTKDFDRAYARFRFDTAKFGNEENLQERFIKAMKTLIKLCGGYVSNEKF